ncbi:MAG: T9SS type A sorting domain-containing protein [Ignavibacterium sp.]|nr:MAG: T9SS type A sorting domain-containing protein [Ignavibacterium sp.]
MKSIHSFIQLMLLTIALNSFVFSSTYYVDRQHPSASNSNPGSLTLPWLTIQHAAETIVAGDTVYIRNGIYNEHIYTVRSGNTTDGFIVFAAYPDETPIIDGTGVLESQNGIIVNQSYIKLIGLEIRNWQDNGIWMENAGFIEINYCEVHQFTGGIGASYGTHDFTLDHVLMHNFDLYGFDATPNGLDCYNGTFNDCIAHTGRDPAQNVDGFALGHGTQHSFVFNRCETYNVFDGFDISAEGSTLNECSAHNCWNGGYKLWQKNIKLINCLGFNNEETNVELDWDNEPGGSTLINCTFYNSQTYNILVENSADTLTLYNCIIAGGDNIGLAFEQMSVSNYHADYNLFHNDNTDRAITVAFTDEFSLQQIQNGNWTSYSNQDSHSLVSFNDNKLFISPSNNDFHLLENNPVVDNGTSVGAPNIDFEGNPRPSGQGVDIGAYEYQILPDVGDNYFNKSLKEYILFQNYPNPFNPKTIITYFVPQQNWVRLKIYDLLGREIQTLVDEEQNQGLYHVPFDASATRDLASGIYMYRIITDNSIDTKKMVLLR